MLRPQNMSQEAIEYSGATIEVNVDTQDRFMYTWCSMRMIHRIKNLEAHQNSVDQSFEIYISVPMK